MLVRKGEDVNLKSSEKTVMKRGAVTGGIQKILSEALGGKLISLGKLRVVIN